MITLYSLGLVLATTGPAPDTSLMASPVTAPPIQLWMSGDRRFREGERVRVQVETEVAGFLLVLHSDTEGRVRVLFPVDPRDDALVQAGRRYEVRAADDSRDTFIADYEGTGLVWAAVAADPWRVEDISRDGRWDYGSFDVDRDADPERALTDVAQRISSPRGFDYDVLGYRVYGSRTYTASHYPQTVYIYDDYLFCGGWNWRFHGCNRWPHDGGLFIGIGYGGFYDPWYYPYRYRYGYGGYGYGGFNPYRPYYPYYPIRPPVFVGGNRPFVNGRSRGYTIERRGFGGTSTTLAGTGGVGGTSRPINWRARDPERSRSRPSTRDNVGGVYGPVGGVSGGAARPARGEGGGTDRPAARPVRSRGGDRGGSAPSARPQSSAGDRGTPSPSVERSRGNGRSRGDLQITDGGERVPAASTPSQASGEAGPVRRARPVRTEDPGAERLVRRGSSTATDRGDAPDVARGVPRERREAPPVVRSEPGRERREPPAARSVPSRERREPPAARSEPRRESPPAARPERRDPPSARSEPRRESPPAAARSAPSRGGGGGGGQSAPSRSRGRGNKP